eukprot:NODE_353_length_8928_cov_0.455204.p6 type:complete len:157 gc:universal NODE_353_length_8928_cov_0.455204:4734-4264(-)
MLLLLHFFAIPMNVDSSNQFLNNVVGLNSELQSHLTGFMRSPICGNWLTLEINDNLKIKIEYDNEVFTITSDNLSDKLTQKIRKFKKNSDTVSALLGAAKFHWGELKTISNRVLHLGNHEKDFRHYDGHYFERDFHQDILQLMSTFECQKRSTING